MFILYSVLVGFVLGLLVGGRPAGLARLQLRWSWVVLVGLVTQVILFSQTVSERIGAFGPPIYVASTLAVVGAILANRAIPGMLVVAAGAASNLAAIVANGGYMPADARAMAALGKFDPTVYSNSAILDHPALEPLTDIFALPAWLPFANVFSIGDVVIGVGVASTIVLAMRARHEPVAPAAPQVPAHAAEA
jgi:Family of unknown function (DUF5317)